MVELTQFAGMVAWLEKEMQLRAEEERHATFETLMDRLGQPGTLPGVLMHFPEEIREALLSAQFTQSAVTSLARANLTGEVLTVAEVAPCFAELTGDLPWAADPKHAQRVAALLDLGGKGVPAGTFPNFAGRVLAMAWLQEQEARRGIEAGDARLHSLIDRLTADKAALDEVLPSLPDTITTVLNSKEFVSMAMHQFDNLDTDGRGELPPRAMAPVLASLSEESPWTVTLEHCMRLALIFDQDRNGLISREEYMEFVKFVVAFNWLEQQAGRQAVEERAAEESEKARLHAMLDRLARDKGAIDDTMAAVPEALRTALYEEEFIAVAIEEFDKLDQDHNGVLSPEELRPAIAALCDSQPWEVSEEHCLRLAHLFNNDSTGLLSANSFVDYMRFVVVMGWLEEQTGADAVELHRTEGEQRVEDVVEALVTDKLKAGNILPRLPAEMQDAMTSPDFVSNAMVEFDRLDSDGNGVLSAEELAPLVCSLTAENPCDVTPEACRRFADIFDSDHNGVISRSEYVGFVQFCAGMAYLEANPQAEKPMTEPDPSTAAPEAAADGHGASRPPGETDLPETSQIELPLQDKLPEWLQDVFQSQEWVLELLSRFDRDDTRQTRALVLDRVSPIVRETAAALPTPLEVGAGASARLVKLFDTAGSGKCRRGDFVHLVKFCLTMAWVEDAANQEEEQAIKEGTVRVHDMITTLAEDKQAMDAAQQELPAWLLETFEDPSFSISTNQEFDSLDANQSGFLSPDQIAPILVKLSQEHPASITRDHCVRLVSLFDVEGTGVISRDDYAELVRFIMVMTWIQDEKGAVAAAVEEPVGGVAREEPAAVEDKPKKAKGKKKKVKEAAPAHYSPPRDMEGEMRDQLGSLYHDVAGSQHVAHSPQHSISAPLDTTNGFPNIPLSQQLRHVQLDHEYYRHKAEALQEQRDTEVKRAQDLQTELSSVLQRLEAAEQQIRHQELDLTLASRVQGSAAAQVEDTSEATLEVLKYEIRTKDRALEVAHYDMVRERRAREKLEQKHGKLVDKCKKFGEVVHRQREYIQTMEMRLNKLGGSAPIPAGFSEPTKLPQISAPRQGWQSATDLGLSGNRGIG